MPCGVDLADDREDLLDEDRRQAERRLVEQQDLRPRSSALARSPASAARRRTASRPSGRPARGDAGTARTRARCSRLISSAVPGVATHLEVLARRSGARRSAVPRAHGRCPRGPSRGPRSGEIPARRTGPCPAWVEQPADRLEGRRLAGAVGPDERDDLALARPRGRCPGARGSCRSRCGRREPQERSSARRTPVAGASTGGVGASCRRGPEIRLDHLRIARGPLPACPRRSAPRGP